MIVWNLTEITLTVTPYIAEYPVTGTISIYAIQFEDGTYITFEDETEAEYEN